MIEPQTSAESAAISASSPARVSVSDKKRLLATLLAFLGVFGVHRFYAGKMTSGIFELLTVGGLGIWTIADFLIIICGVFKDAEGLKIVDWT